MTIYLEGESHCNLSRSVNRAIMIVACENVLFPGAIAQLRSAQCCAAVGVSMKNTPEGVRLAATDLSAHLGCQHVTTLDLAVVHGQRDAPQWHDPDVIVLQERGREHEATYLESLRAAGLRIVDLRGAGDADAVAQTLAAMLDGAEVIAQAGLQCGSWFGRADMLRKVATPSALGAWSYEVYDCKLARETKAG